MAISYTIQSHAVSFPSKVKAAECGHIYNIVLTADVDNGNLVGKGAATGFDKYTQAAATRFVGKVLMQAPNGNWYVEVVDPGDALYVHMPVVIEEEYSNRFKAEANWYNPSGSVARGYELAKGDIFELSDAGFTATPVLVSGTDYYVELSGMKLAHADAAPTEGDKAAIVTAAPTTATKGQVGEMICDGSYLYVCTAVSATGEYTWKKATLA